MKPILFNTEMVDAILSGRKTVTRRIFKEKAAKPFGVGDMLYVRETWSPVYVHPMRYLYKAGCPEAENLPVRWHPSIHMPKAAARIFLRVTDVRVERLQDCGNMQAKDEGFSCCSQFARLWDTTIKSEDIERFGWLANPWVWVIEFERLKEVPHD